MPAWERERGLALQRATVTRWSLRLSFAERFPALLRAVLRDVDLIALTANSVRNQPIGDPPRPGSPLWRCGRSQVVFTEESDSSPPDWGSVSEACEIGGLGTLARGAAGRVVREGEVSCGFLRRRDDLIGR